MDPGSMPALFLVFPGLGKEKNKILAWMPLNEKRGPRSFVIRFLESPQDGGFWRAGRLIFS